MVFFCSVIAAMHYPQHCILSFLAGPCKRKLFGILHLFWYCVHTLQIVQFLAKLLKDIFEIMSKHDVEHYTHIISPICIYEFHLGPRGSNGTVAVRLSLIVWPGHSMRCCASATSWSISIAWQSIKMLPLG